MAFHVKIDTGNAAFDDEGNGGVELARILRELARDLELTGPPRKGVDNALILRDINGNRVGTAETKGR